MSSQQKITVSHISGREQFAQQEGDLVGKYKLKDEIIPIETKSQLELDEKKVQEENGESHQVMHPTSYMSTLVHIFKGNIGSGLLAMGDAYKNGGLVFATVMTAILGVICVHAQHILLNCAEEVHSLTYAETVRLVFANGRTKPLASMMKQMVNVLLCITQLGFCCVYIVFIGNNIKTILDQYGIELSLSIHMTIILAPIIVCCMVRNLKFLTPFSIVANILMALGVGVILYEATRDLPHVNTRRYIAPVQQLPLFFGTVVYAFEGIGLVLPLKHEMRRPELFQKPLGVLNVGMVIVSLMFIVVGFLGYLKWGEEVAGSLTLNLTPGQILSNVVQAVILLAIMLSFPLQFYVPIEITWPTIRKKYGQTSPVLKELLYRMLLVLLTFTLAQSIPHLSLFISLVGAVSSTALALIFPPMIEFVAATQSDKGITISLIIKDLTIILLGLFIFTTGTYESIKAIIIAFK